MWRTSCMNRYFLPISKLPPLGPDPRPAFGRGRPGCCPGPPSAMRTGRLMTRWASMPSMLKPSQQASSPEGAETVRHCWAASHAEPSGDLASHLNSRRAESSQGQRSRAGTSSSLHSSRRCAAHGGRDFPFVPCICCERASPIPRLTKLALGDVAASLVAAQLEADAAASRQGGAGQQRSVMHVRVMESEEAASSGDAT